MQGIAVFLLVIVVIVGILVYFLPSLVAWQAHKRNMAAIFVLNLLAGWTVVGWVIALVWSFTVDRRNDV